MDIPEDSCGLRHSIQSYLASTVCQMPWILTGDKPKNLKNKKKLFKNAKHLLQNLAARTHGVFADFFLFLANHGV